MFGGYATYSQLDISDLSEKDIPLSLLVIK